ncbi:MAG: hypothetical protein M3Q68_05630 [Actinomycetota bacterium]|nr:hypothetical protein [Actinomycetota bacterium]
MAMMRPCSNAPVLRCEAETYRCDLCWESFDDPIELMRHEAIEADMVFVLEETA